ncbi:MAG: DNA repair ATPase, partial [Thermoanaerobaculia bacterium]
ALDPEGKATYVDNRGERDHVFPPSHDFEWTETTRDHYVLGRHPHVNVLDQVFVEAVGGDLTVKVEDNTEDGRGIYREPVDEPDQSLDDGEIHYAEVGTLILLKVLPYNETRWRYLVFNTRTRKVDRIDAIGQACLLLPEDHGLIFPGGYYLQSGETKTFEGDVAQMEFLQVRRSPNGEDVVYVFHERESGRAILLPYNMIRKEVQNPIHCHGYSFFGDGRLVIFRAVSAEPTRVHPMQVWQTPFMSDVHAAKVPSRGTFLESVGNADLVRGISDALSLGRMIERQEPSAQGYEDLAAACVRMSDAYYWLDREEVSDLASTVGEVRSNAEKIIDEFEKVETIRRQARQAVDGADAELDELCAGLRQEEIGSVERFVEALSGLRRQRGHLITLEEMRYVDLEQVESLEARAVEEFDQLSARAVDFLDGDEALAPYHRSIDDLAARAEAVDKAADAKGILEELEGIGAGLELLTDVVGGLEIDDATLRTRILEGISEVLGSLNRARALLEARRKELRSGEAVAEFGVQFKLFSQSVAGAMAVCDSPEKCDEQLSKLMLQLEELESRFGELDEFSDELATKREDVYEAFSSRRQSLLDERQRRAGRMKQAAERILQGIGRRAERCESADELNTYFVSDTMVAKVRDLSAQLREIQESVKADELDSRLKSAREDAARSLRDRQDIFEQGAEVIRLGRHRFSVNTQPFDLTMVPKAPRTGTGASSDLEMAFHLTGTDFFDAVTDAEFADTRDYWDQLVVSETDEVYRGEYLAAAMLFDAEEEKNGLSLARLQEAVVGDTLVEEIRRYAAERYDEGYERGLHDQDAALILEKLLSLYSTADLLRYAPRPRAAACLFWAFYRKATSRVSWERRARSLARLRDAFAHSPAIAELCEELAAAMTRFFEDHRLDAHPDDLH